MAGHATPATSGVDHLGLSVRDLESTRGFFCDCLGWRIVGWPGVVVEFAPEFSGKGPKIHFIVREPSGIRIEFAFDPRVVRPR